MYPKRVVPSRWISLGLTLAVAFGAFLVGALAEGRIAARGADVAYDQHNLLRLHVVAHSDAPYDQMAKLNVRDAVLRELAGWQEPKSRIELERWIREREGALIRAAKAALADLGLEYEVRVEVGDFPFPQKSWGELVLPAGQYRAVRIIIGDGAGKNWWCVLFPPLCFVEESGNHEALSQGVAHARGSLEEPADTALIKATPTRNGGSYPDGVKQDRDGAAHSTQPVEVEWRVRLWESLSQSAVAGRVKELVDASLYALKRISPD
ncbi:MAG TPA: stage II sporulation protein R [Limnochordia bacterium]|nr:stage II sporulation protein R [Limnochordia bacterium]